MHTCWRCIVSFRARQFLRKRISPFVGSFVTDDAGSTMVTTLGFGLCAAVIATTLQTMVVYQAQTLRLYGASRQAYWLGRGAALTVLSELKTNPSTVPASRTVSCAGGQVVENVTVGTVDSARIEVSVAAAVNVITFTYDPSTQKVVAWQDNTP